VVGAELPGRAHGADRGAHATGERAGQGCGAEEPERVPALSWLLHASLPDTLNEAVLVSHGFPSFVSISFGMLERRIPRSHRIYVLHWAFCFTIQWRLGFISLSLSLNHSLRGIPIIFMYHSRQTDTLPPHCLAVFCHLILGAAMGCVSLLSQLYN
jgi:hypothetical protein